MKIFKKERYPFLMVTRLFLYFVEIVLAVSVFLAIALNAIPAVAVEFSAYNHITYNSGMLDVTIGTLLTGLFFVIVAAVVFLWALRAFHKGVNKLYAFIKRKYIEKIKTPVDRKESKSRKGKKKKKGAVKLETSD